MVQYADINGDGQVDYEEFVAATMQVGEGEAAWAMHTVGVRLLGPCV